MIDIEDIYGQLGDNISAVLGQYDVGLNNVGGWDGTLVEVGADYTSGYWVFVDDSAILEVQGLPANPGNYYSAGGWELISYPYHYSQSIQDALEGVTGIALIYGQGRAAILYGNTWEGSLTSFDGGQGYWVLCDENTEFSI